MENIKSSTTQPVAIPDPNIPNVDGTQSLTPTISSPTSSPNESSNEETFEVKSIRETFEKKIKEAVPVPVEVETGSPKKGARNRPIPKSLEFTDEPPPKTSPNTSPRSLKIVETSTGPIVSRTPPAVSPKPSPRPPIESPTLPIVTRTPPAASPKPSPRPQIDKTCGDELFPPPVSPTRSPKSIGATNPAARKIFEIESSVEPPISKLLTAKKNKNTSPSGNDAEVCRLLKDTQEKDNKRRSPISTSGKREAKESETDSKYRRSPAKEESPTPVTKNRETSLVDNLADTEKDKNSVTSNEEARKSEFSEPYDLTPRRRFTARKSTDNEDFPSTGRYRSNASSESEDCGNYGRSLLCGSSPDTSEQKGKDTYSSLNTGFSSPSKYRSVRRSESPGVEDDDSDSEADRYFRDSYKPRRKSDIDFDDFNIEELRSKIRDTTRDFRDKTIATSRLVDDSRSYTEERDSSLIRDSPNRRYSSNSSDESWSRYTPRRSPLYSSTRERPSSIDKRSSSQGSYNRFGIRRFSPSESPEKSKSEDSSSVVTPSPISYNSAKTKRWSPVYSPLRRSMKIEEVEMERSAASNGVSRTTDNERNSRNRYNQNGTKEQLPTISEIKAAIPKHCFKSTVLESMFYVLKDFIIIMTLFFMAYWVVNSKSNALIVAFTPLYWFAQGTMFFSVFVLGHDCNHGSFSSYALLNDCLGTILHTFVLTPYYQWKLSHRHHHNNTGNMDKDEIFYPIRERDDNKKSYLPLFGLGFGWIAYLWKGFGPRPMNHWVPTHSIFQKHMQGCLLSLVSVVVWVGGLYHYANTYGLAYLLYYYAVPVFICGAYIVVVTFLHHSDTDLPWYGDDVWENVKGKLSSVDRDYGPLHDVIHTIGTHQVHHLFPIIPHYHLREATEHFRQEFPELVHIRDTPILPAFWTMFYKYTSQCLVSNDAQVHYYK